MADFFGTHNTEAFETRPAINVPAGVANGRVRVLYDEFIVPASSPPGAADVIFMGGLLIPKGARILDAVIANDVDYSSGTSLIDVEVVVDGVVTTLITGHDGDAAAAMTRVLVGDQGTIGFELLGEGEIRLNPTGDVNVAGAVIRVQITFAQD